MSTGAAPARQRPSTRGVAFGTLWNVLGRAGPQLVALVTTPLLIDMLGPNRWGIFTLAMALVGVSGVLDFGIGRALTRGVAECRHAGADAQAATLVRTGLLVLGGLGIAGGLLAAACVQPLAWHVLAVPAPLRQQTATALYVVCLAIPIVILNSALWGVIAAFGRFRAANLVGLVVLAAAYAGQVLVLFVVDDLAAVMLVLLASKIAFLVAFWGLCRSAMPSLARAGTNVAQIGPLVRLGGWMTVSNVVFPILNYADRFIIAAMLSAAAIGYYATPSDLMGRVHIITGATLTALFPAIAASHRAEPAHTTALFGRSIVTVSLVLFPLASVAASFSQPLLTLWVGAEYAGHAAPVFRLLALGTLMGAADGIVATLLDAIGEPRINALFSIAELLLYIPLLVLMLHLFGVVGGAVAFVVRQAIDFVIRLGLATRRYPAIAATRRRVTVAVFGGTALLLVPMGLPALPARCLAIAAVSTIFALATYGWCATGQERALLRARLGAMVPVPRLR